MPLCVCDWSCEDKCVVGYPTAVWGTLCTLSFSSENTLSPVIFFDRVVASTFLQTNRFYPSKNTGCLTYSWFKKHYIDIVNVARYIA